MDSNIEKALEILATLDKTKEPGHYEVSPDISYNIEVYETKKEAFCQFESHEKYADIQCILEGKEIIYSIPSRELEERENLLEERDVIFYQNTKKGKAHLLKAGDYIILYPGDAHKAGVCAGEKRMVKKAVFKVRYR